MVVASPAEESQHADIRISTISLTSKRGLKGRRICCVIVGLNVSIAQGPTKTRCDGFNAERRFVGKGIRQQITSCQFYLLLEEFVFENDESGADIGGAV